MARTIRRQGKGSVIRTQVYLPPDVRDAIAERAKQLEVSNSAVIAETMARSLDVPGHDLPQKKDHRKAGDL